MRITTPAWTPDAGASLAVALEVLLHGPISRSDIARRLDLSAGSLTRLSAPLIESGLLVELDERSESPRAGRPSRPLDVVADSRHFVGMKLTGTDLRAVVTDLRANVLAETSCELVSQRPEDVARAIADLTTRVSRGRPAPTALGIGIGGLVADHRTVRSAPFLGWEDVALGDMVEDETGLPAVIENDVVAFTEAQHWFGVGRGLDRFAVITLGAGIGYGLVIHGDIVVDDDSGLGLVGHWPLDPFGPVCPAGHRGCARSVLTSTAISQAVSAAVGRTVNYAESLELAAAGDSAAMRVVNDAGRALGRLLAAVANLTAAERIVLGGEGIALTQVAATAIDEGIALDRDPRARALDLVSTPGDDSQWCRGAAVIAIQRFVLGKRS